ncbi:MAG: hypothetical protein GKR94_29405 [Gammaproteobacteria bacterium]|nr:hypothetical protein [Gammaproteobacteria bacterium]
MKQQKYCSIEICKLAKFTLYPLIVLCLAYPVHAQVSASDASSDRQDLKMQTRQYSDWTYQCLVPSKQAAEVQQPECEIAQSVRAQQNGANIELFNVALIHADDKAGKVKWALVVWMPLGLDIHLPSDFGLIVGKKKPFLTRFRHCNAQGCQVVIPADHSLLTNLKRANNGAGLFRLLNGKVIRVEFSLKGFTKAFNALASGDLLEE